MLSINLGYIKNAMPRKTIELFDEVKKKGLLEQIHSEKGLNYLNEAVIDNSDSNMIIYLLVVNALALLYDSLLSELITKDIPSYYLSHPHIQSALIDMWVNIFDH